MTGVGRTGRSEVAQRPGGGWGVGGMRNAGSLVARHGKHRSMSSMATVTGHRWRPCALARRAPPTACASAESGGEGQTQGLFTRSCSGNGKRRRLGRCQSYAQLLQQPLPKKKRITRAHVQKKKRATSTQLAATNRLAAGRHLVNDGLRVLGRRGGAAQVPRPVLALLEHRVHRPLNGVGLVRHLHVPQHHEGAH